jgi:hypothetical protein
MPCYNPERSGDTTIAVLKLYLDQLRLPHRTWTERMLIHQVLRDLTKQVPPADLGYAFHCFRENYWHSSVLKLDLEHLFQIEDIQMELEFYRYPRPWDGKKLNKSVLGILDRYRRERLPEITAQFQQALKSKPRNS